MDDVYSKVNDTLVRLVNEIWEVEGDAIITEEFKDITNNDMHIIEKIDLGEGKNMSAVARAMNVTVGTLTSSMNSLVKKGYVERFRSETDRRVVHVRLTEKGVAAFYHHKNYHDQMTAAVMEKMTEAEIPVLVKMLEGLIGFFRGYPGLKNEGIYKEDIGSENTEK